MRRLSTPLMGAVAAGLLSTLGDLVWALWIPEHRPVYGLAHGSLLFAGIGGYLGLTARRPVPGAIGGLVIGFLAASGFYGLAPLLGNSAMFVAWMALWVMLAGLNGPVLRERRSVRRALARGCAAAAGSGVAFYAISGIWLDPSPGGPNYGYHLGAWTLAFLPGFLALYLWMEADV